MIGGVFDSTTVVPANSEPLYKILLLFVYFTTVSGFQVLCRSNLHSLYFIFI